MPPIERANDESSIRSVFAAFLFAFWCGEMVQMVTGDLFTYWRNMVVFFAVLALVQEVPEESLSRSRALESR